MLVVAGWPASWEQAAFVALLARPDGVLFHLTAARVQGVLPSAPTMPYLLVPPTSSGRSSVARIHRGAIDPSEVSSWRGLRCTSPERTLVDLATRLGPRVLARSVDAALSRRLTTVTLVERSARAARLAIGPRSSLFRALDVWRPAIRPGSVAEARLLRQLSEWGFEQPDRQVPIVDQAGEVVARVDIGWQSRRLGLEHDSIEWHGPAQWASDEERHRMVESLGWVLVHADADDLRPGSTFRRRLRAVYDGTGQASERAS